MPIISILLFAAGLILLVVGSDQFINSAIKISKSLGIPEMFIGATIVSLGTTLPELMFSSSAAAQGYNDMSIGNAIGSIICNTALIAGLIQIIRPTELDRAAFNFSSKRFLIYAGLYCTIAVVFGQIPRWGGAFLLVLMIFYTMKIIKQPSSNIQNGTDDKHSSTIKEIIFLIIEAVSLYIGADLLVDNGTVIARWLSVPERVISLTLVALGTSLPELVTAISALKKGHSSLSLGNILGANTLNLLWVGGVSSLIHPLHFTKSILVLDIPVMLAVTLILCVPAMISGKMKRWQGAVLLTIYIGYLIYLF